MQHIYIYGYKKTYQKYIATSARVGYATRSLNVSSGPELKEPQLKITRFVQVPTALLVRVQYTRKDLYKAVEGSSTRSIVLSINNKS